MKAFTLESSGGSISNVSQPEPSPTQLLVKVHAVGLNRVDLLTVEAARQGGASSHGSSLGRELAGTVVAVGDQVTAYREGDHVMGSTRGALAEYALLEQALASPLPENGLSMEEAAVLPVALNTMHDALVNHGGLMAGHSVLVQGASSGVGLMALQIAREMKAGFVIGTSRNAERRAKLAAFGADVALDSSASDWVQEVLEATNNNGVECTIDQIGPTVANGNLHATALGGRIINVGRLGGKKGEFDFDLHALRRITYVGVTFRTRTLPQVADIVQRVQADLGSAISQGKLRLPIDRSFPLGDTADALELMAENRHFGKIAITL